MKTYLRFAVVVLSACFVVSVLSAAPPPDPAALKMQAILKDPANADLFRADSAAPLPAAEKWNCAVGTDFAVYDQSRKMWIGNFASAFARYTQIHRHLMGDLSLNDGYPLTIVGMRSGSTPPNSDNTQSFTCDAGGALILLPGVTEYDSYWVPSWPSYGGYYGGRGYYGGYRSYGGYGGYGSGGYYGSSGPYEARSKKIDWDGTSQAYGSIIGRKNNLLARNILEEGVALLMQTATMQSRGGMNMNVSFTKDRQPPVDLFIEPRLRALFTREWAGALTSRQRAGMAFAFAHLCLVSKEGRARWANAFVDFTIRTAGVAVTEDMFRQSFGIGYDEMDKLLSEHMKSLREQPSRWDFTPALPQAALAAPPKITSRRATDAEVGLVKAQMFMVAARKTPASTTDPRAILRANPRLPAGSLASLRNARPDSRPFYAQLARRELLARFSRGTADARLLATAGDLENEFGSRARARRYYLLALDAGADLPGVYLALANMAMNDAQAVSPALDAATAQACAQWLVAAAALKPARSDVFVALLRVYEQSQIKPSPEAWAALDALARQFRYDSDAIYRTASLRLKNGFDKEAAALIALGMKSSYNPQVLANFEKLQALVKSQPHPVAP